MVALKRVGSVGALVRVSGGIEKGQWRRWSGSNGGVRVNGGIEKGGRWSGSMGVLNNGGSMGALKKINEEGIGQGQWGY